MHTWLAVAIVAVFFGLAPSVILVWGRLHGARLRMAALGAVMWLCAFPFLMGIPFAVASSGASTLAVFVSLSVTAGVVEELSRYGWFRMAGTGDDLAGWAAAVMAGLGHGGIEAAWFGLQAMGSWMMLTGRFPLPQGATMPTMGDVVPMVVGRPPLLMVHVGFSVWVWKARHDGWRWLVGAMVAHMVLDLVVFCVPLLLPQGGMGVAAAAIGLWAVAALWAVLRLRPARPDGVSLRDETGETVDAPAGAPRHDGAGRP